MSIPALKRVPWIETSCLFTNTQDPKRMSRFKLSNNDFLEEVRERTPCPQCGKSRRYFCYNCCLPVASLKDKLPYLQLPIPIDIIKHAQEVEGKSTAMHAAVLAPQQVKVHIYPNVPDYSHMKVVLVFPGKNSQTLKEYLDDISKNQIRNEEKSLNEELKPIAAHPETGHSQLPIDRIVFIDSTWRQTKRLYADERINQIPCIVLKEHDSLFWRHQRNKPLTHLSTIEAIYYFLVELDEASHPETEYDGKYDNILFFFNYMYGKIRQVYDPRIVQKLNEMNLALQPSSTSHTSHTSHTSNASHTFNTSHTSSSSHLPPPEEDEKGTNLK